MVRQCYRLGVPMSDLPVFSRLVAVKEGAIYGLIARRAEMVETESFEFGWQRDRALTKAIDAALQDAANGLSSETAGKPRWLEGLVRRELTSASTASRSGDRFMRVRLLERLDLISVEPDDTYVLAMISALGPDKAEKLRSDPDLAQGALWRVFEVEGGGEVSLTNVDRFGGEEWRRAFIELVSDSTLDRERVLAACLGALGRDFAAYRGGWFSATYLALEPAVEESSPLQPELRRLLGSSVPATAAFALKQLQRIHAAGTLEVEETLEALTPATLVKTKGTALDALRLARAAGTDYPGAVERLASSALGHPNADVQRAAAELLAAHGKHDAVAAARDDLGPSVRQDLGLAEVAVAVGQHRLVQTLAPVPPPIAAGDVPERVAALLEGCPDVGEFETVLAALVAPGTERSLEPLRKRATQIVERGPRTEQGDAWLPGQVARLVLSLLGVAVPAAYPESSAARFVVHRMRELRESGGPLLATPDLPGGWVSAQALVTRLRSSQQLRHHDVVAALLRLHPDRRDFAGTEGQPDAVRFALDGMEPTGRLFRRRRSGPTAWWVAAERSRAPYGDTETPRIESQVRTHIWQENGTQRTSQYAKFSFIASSAATCEDDQPTELSAGGSDRGGSGQARFLADWVPALAGIWPQDAEHFLAYTALPVLESPNWAEAAHDVPRTLDALARHPGRMGVLATHTLAAGLSAAQRDHRLHAIDAFVDLVPTGRIAINDIAAVMARSAAAWPANRWAESLTAAASAPGGAPAVVDLLTALLPGLPADHRGLNKLLDVLREETLRFGWKVDDPELRQWLGQFSGSSATAKTAQRLLV